MEWKWWSGLLGWVLSGAMAIIAWMNWRTSEKAENFKEMSELKEAYRKMKDDLQVRVMELENNQSTNMQKIANQEKRIVDIERKEAECQKRVNALMEILRRDETEGKSHH